MVSISSENAPLTPGAVATKKGPAGLDSWVLTVATDESCVLQCQYRGHPQTSQRVKYGKGGQMETDTKATTRRGKGNVLWVLTYQQIADWTGLSLNSVRTYGQRKEFERKDIDSVLRWVNRRRSARGLPLIGVESADDGQIQKTDEVDTTENSNGSSDA